MQTPAKKAADNPPLSHLIKPVARFNLTLLIPELLTQKQIALHRIMLTARTHHAESWLSTPFLVQVDDNTDSWARS
jgi:hypothetical protein